MKDYYSTKACQFAGFATPESTLESWTWARSRGDKTAMLQCLTPEEQKNLQRELAVISEAEFNAQTIELMKRTEGHRIVKRESVSTEEIILHVCETPDADHGDLGKLVFIKCGAEWKMSQPKRD